MVVSYFNADGARVRPYETDAVLIVDANTVFPASVASQSLEPVARRYTKIAQDGGGIELVKLSPGYFQYRLRTRSLRRSSGTTVENILRTAVLE